MKAFGFSPSPLAGEGWVGEPVSGVSVPKRNLL